MKKLLLLILVLCSSLSIKAQVDSGQQVSVFSSEDESYNLVYKANFVDVYFVNGLHYFLIYKICLDHIKGGITSLKYQLYYHEGFPANVRLVEPFDHGEFDDADGGNPTMKFQDMFWLMGSKTNRVREVRVEFNR